MDRRMLRTMLLATSGLALAAAGPAQAACPERVELLKQFAEGGTLDEATKAEIDDLALEAMESDEACERAVAELEQRLQVEVRGDEVLPLSDQTQGDDGSTATDEGGNGGQSAAGQEQPASGGGTGAAGTGQQSTSGDQAAASSGAQAETTIGGGLDMPREAIDAKYGPLAWLGFDEIIGAQVVDPEGDPIAQIIALVRDRSSDDFFAVVDAGDRDGILVPIDRFEIADGDRIAMAGDPGDLQNMPAYEGDQYEDLRQ